MKRHIVSITSIAFLALGLAAWLIGPSFKIDWFSMIAISIALSAVDVKFRDIQKRQNP